MEWFKTAKAGDKLVCINDKGWYENGDRSQPSVGPKLNEVVTISETRIRNDNKFGIFFVEYKLWYLATCFKPVTPLSTEKGMEVFRSILNGKLRVEDKELENV
jgi:hypothetical protein